MALVTRISYYKLRKLAWPGIILSVFFLLLIWVPHLGIRAGGAVRWLNFGLFSFQVTEMVKVALIIFLAHFLTEKVNHIREFREGMLVPLGIMVTLVGLILLQPDFGTTFIIALITFLMIFLAGGRIVHLAGLAALFLPVALWLLLHKSYRLARLTAFLDPWKDPRHSGFQIIQSLISFGSGGTFGVGIGDGMQKLFYLPGTPYGFYPLGDCRGERLHRCWVDSAALHHPDRPRFPDFAEGPGSVRKPAGRRAHDDARAGGVHQHRGRDGAHPAEGARPPVSQLRGHLPDDVPCGGGHIVEYILL